MDMGKIILWLGLSIASGIAYRWGGKGGFKGAKLIRRLGCSLLALGLFIGLKGANLDLWWVYVLFVILNYGALSTYHDYVGYDNFYLTGLFYGLAALPIALGHWLGFGIRTILLTGLIGYLRERTGKVFIEEFFSGFLYMATLPLLLR